MHNLLYISNSVTNRVAAIAFLFIEPGMRQPVASTHLCVCVCVSTPEAIKITIVVCYGPYMIG